MSAQPLAAASQLYIVPNSLQPAQPLPVSPPPQQADKSDEFWEIWL